MKLVLLATILAFAAAQPTVHPCHNGEHNCDPASTTCVPDPSGGISFTCECQSGFHELQTTQTTSDLLLPFAAHPNGGSTPGNRGCGPDSNGGCVNPNPSAGHNSNYCREHSGSLRDNDCCAIAPGGDHVYGSAWQNGPGVHCSNGYHQVWTSRVCYRTGQWTAYNYECLPELPNHTEFCVATPAPTANPTKSPTKAPTKAPTKNPTANPTANCQMTCKIGTSGLIEVTHDASSGHTEHKCYVNDDEDCVCKCWNHKEHKETAKTTYYKSNFNDQMNDGWTCGGITACGEYQHICGGYDKKAASNPTYHTNQSPSDEITKDFTGFAFGDYKLTMSYYHVDSWDANYNGWHYGDGENGEIYLEVDGTRTLLWESPNIKHNEGDHDGNQCGRSYWTEASSAAVAHFQVPKSGNFKIIVSSTLNQEAKDESFGIGNIELKMH